MKVDNQLFSDNMDVWSLMDGYHWKQDKQGGAKHVEEFNMFEFKPMLILGGANHRHLIATSHRSLELSVLRKTHHPATCLHHDEHDNLKFKKIRSKNRRGSQ